MAPRHHIIRACFEVSHPPVKLCPLRSGWVREAVLTGNAAPESLDKFKLLLHTELAGLLKKMGIHAKSIAIFGARVSLRFMPGFGIRRTLVSSVFSFPSGDGPEA